MRVVLLSLFLASPALAQDGVPAAPATILAVADSLPELRRMIADCAPDTVLPDDDASWATMTNSVEAALWRGRQDPALVAEVLDRLATPFPDPANCEVAAFRFSVVSSAMPEYGGWPRTAARMFENLGLPFPDPLPDAESWRAVTRSAMSAVEPWRLPMMCGTLLAPEYSARAARILEQNADRLVAALADAGYPPHHVAGLADLTRPAELAEPNSNNREREQAACVGRQADWLSALQVPPPEGLPEEVAQILAAP
jgi:hypothetical protein